jgi:glycosyltransferase involved in cell wall biosynthesis
MKVLFVCTESPLPCHGGAALRSWGLMRSVASFAEVGIVTLLRSPAERNALNNLAAICTRVESVAATRTAWRKGRDWIRAQVTGTPYLVQSARDRRLQRRLTKLIAEWRPDIVQAETIGAAAYLSSIDSNRVRRLYSAHNVEHRMGVAASRHESAMRRMQVFEQAVAGDCDAVLAVSAEEAAWFQHHARRVEVVPNALFVGEQRYLAPSLRRGQSVIFAGRLDYDANIEAAEILARQVIPLLRQRLPEVRCIIAGRNPPARVRALTGSGVSVLADPDDMATVLDQAGVLLSPLKSGAGSRLKLIEAAACGVPIVATPFSAEGLALGAGHDYLDGNTPAALADAAIRVLTDTRLADQLATRARQAVERHHDFDQLRPAIRNLYEDLAGYHRPQ